MKTLTSDRLNRYFQLNGSYLILKVFAYPVTAVISFIIFSNVKNGQSKFSLALGLSFLL